MKKTRRRPFLILMSLAVLLLAGIIVFSVTFEVVRTRQVVRQDCQPATLDYASYSPYCLSFVREERGLEFRGAYYVVFVGKESDNDLNQAYGYRDGWQFFSSDRAAIETRLKAARVQWQPEGISLEAEGGLKIFVQKSDFTGGR